jgi:hypothetical protein
MMVSVWDGFDDGNQQQSHRDQGSGSHRQKELL